MAKTARSATPTLTPTATIPMSEFAARRERVLKGLRGSTGVVFAGEGSAPLFGKWRPDFSFLYLTGIDNEAGAAVLFDPTAPDPRRRILLFLRPMDPEVDRWDGYRDEINSAMRKRTGFQTVVRSGAFPRGLAEAARRSRKLACLHPFANHTGNVSPDLAVYRKVAERVPGVAIEDRTMLLPELRAIKSAAELRLMRLAAAATARGYDAVLGALRPGTRESEVQHLLESNYLAAGADRETGGVAYNSIVGSGLNATVLHYMDNGAACEDGDLLVIDSGAQVGRYACDVTRTLPVNGRFSKRQRELYNIVLRSQLAAIRAARPGAFMWQVDKASRDVIDAAGLGDYYIHGIGHQLGLEVHDVTPDGRLRPGMVVTIEPGVYIPAEKTGIRIEDDILITARGNTNLTAAIPKTIDKIERAMGRARR